MTTPSIRACVPLPPRQPDSSPYLRDFTSLASPSRLALSVNCNNLITKLTAARADCRLTDVTFSFAESSETIQAHKMVLAMGSPVFEAMLYGCEWKETKEIVEISEISPVVFNVLVEYLYSGKLETNFPVNTAINLLYAASKYCVDDLVTLLLSTLSDSITLDNVLLILETAILFNAQDLKSKCWFCIECDTDRIVLTENFEKLSRNVLKEIVEHEPLNVTEIGMYNSVIRWALSATSVKSNDASSSETLRSAIGEEILHLIRFPTMDPRDFADGPAKSGMLTEAEINNILLSFFHQQKILTLNFSQGLTGLEMKRLWVVLAKIRPTFVVSARSQSWTLRRKRRKSTCFPSPVAIADVECENTARLE